MHFEACLRELCLLKYALWSLEVLQMFVGIHEIKQISKLVKLEAADGKTYDVQIAREHHLWIRMVKIL